MRIRQVQLTLLMIYIIIIDTFCLTPKNILHKICKVIRDHMCIQPSCLPSTSTLCSAWASLDVDVTPWPPWHTVWGKTLVFLHCNIMHKSNKQKHLPTSPSLRCWRSLKITVLWVQIHPVQKGDCALTKTSKWTDVLDKGVFKKILFVFYEFNLLQYKQSLSHCVDLTYLRQRGFVIGRVGFLCLNFGSNQPWQRFAISDCCLVL